MSFEVWEINNFVATTFFFIFFTFSLMNPVYNMAANYTFIQIMEQKCMERWNVYVGCWATKEVNLFFSNENAMTDFHKIWYMGSSGYDPLGLLSQNVHI